ncbi:hypothetical protein S675_005218 [Salmonella enterica subsp. enterica]|nr:hypothetical protein [Salmonella enterica subsp. enterica]
MSDKQNALDVAAFSMVGNLLSTLVDKELVSREEAAKIVAIARTNLSQALTKNHRDSSLVDTDWHLDNLLAKLGVEQKKD